MVRTILLLMVALLPGIARAAEPVQLTSQVFVEKIVASSDGKKRIVLDQPSLVTPGDRLVFVLRYQNKGTTASENFVVTNPMPSAVAYQDAPGTSPQISVDGGRSWGQLSDMKIKQHDGTNRSARADDVTHVRWTLAEPLRAGAGGRLTFRGIVR
jgi:uncharacterized repeat protein (TIGR01451 family)